MPEINPVSAENTTRKYRILAFLPNKCGKEWGFWYRELGPIVLTLRSMGHDAWLVLLRSDELPSGKEPVIAASQEELEDPQWWKSHSPDAVLLNLWAASRWEGVRTAVRQATPRLIEKFDTSGIFCPDIWFGRYLYEGYSHRRDAGRSALRSALTVFARACLLKAMPGLLDKKRVECISRMPVLTAETPLAVERTKRYIRMFGKPVPRVVCMPHAVDETELRSIAGVVKENKIVSVGRWDAHQKNFPLLLEALHRFLALYPDWSADLPGKLPDGAEELTAKIPKEILARINLPGFTQREELSGFYRKSKIFFMSSRHESFNIAAAEALCCGCSVVGSAAIASVPFFCGRKSGTPVAHYSVKSMVDSLCVEAEAWKNGDRDPVAISTGWIPTLGSQRVTRQVLEAFGFDAPPL